MKVLWLSNGPVPLASEAFGIDKSNIEGWKIQIFDRLIKESGISVSYLFPSDISRDLEDRAYKGAEFCAFNRKLSLEKLVNTFKVYVSEYKPDVIHIWGTEYIHSYAMTEACNGLGISKKAVISIQGLVSMGAFHYMGNIPGEVQCSVTLRDFVKNDSLRKQQRSFIDRGYYEQEAIRNVKHIIGRTFWDSACSELINPERRYHHNNETLRKSFYEKRWDIDKTEKHSLFISQSYYPIKGFHNVLIACNMIKDRYPDLKIYVSGADNAFIRGIKTQGYGKYIQSLMSDYGLNEKVIHLGSLDEKEMADRYLKSNIFVSASSIENSPNSVGEAMLLGMPVVSSNVGGVSDMLVHDKEGFLYQADAPYMLAYYIDAFFKSESIQREYGANARKHALRTHDFELNYQKLLEIYKEIGEIHGE